MPVKLGIINCQLYNRQLDISQYFKLIAIFLFQRKELSNGAQSIQRNQEKSAALLIGIIVVFVVCHVHRLAFRLYEMALPQSSLYEHFLSCEQRGQHHVPVAIYFLAYSHYFFLVLNSSINFIIYCAMGRQFRKQLKSMLKWT